MGKKLLKDEKDVKYAGVYYNFEIFDMQEKQIPVDSVELKETVHAFSWEPVGSKFAVIHGDAQSLNVSFYGIKAGHTIVMLKKYSDQFNAKDKMRQSKASKELIEKRRELMERFREDHKVRLDIYNESLETRMALRNGVDTNNIDESELEEEIVEFLVKEEETIVQD